MHRFFLKTRIDNPQNISITDKEIINKIKKVLRQKIGDTFFLFDIDGQEFQVIIESINANQIKCKYVSKEIIDRELEIVINLYMALLKKDKFEWICQKAAEIGVKKIIPMVTENCVVTELSKNKLDRYKKILAEATMQCGGQVVPELAGLINFEQAVKKLDSASLNIIPYEQEQENQLINVLKLNKSKSVNVFIGPEGGFSQFEIDLAKQNKLIPTTLGKRILRAETAAIVSCGIIAQSTFKL